MGATTLEKATDAAIARYNRKHGVSPFPNASILANGSETQPTTSLPE